MSGKWYVEVVAPDAESPFLSARYLLPKKSLR
jgi:hypothetical protein